LLGFSFNIYYWVPPMSTPTSITRPRQTRRFQFSLVALLAATGWVALLCLALKTPTSFWCAALFLLASIAAFTSILGIIYLPAGSRAFAVGYCVFSFGYAGSLLIVEKNFSSSQFVSETKLPTTQFAEWLFARMHPNSMGGLGGGNFGGGMGGGFGGGGGGFFSVDSSSEAEAQDAAESEEAAEAQDPMGSAGSADPFGNGSMGGGAMPGSSGMGGSMEGSGFAAGGPVGPGAPGIVPVFYRSEHFIAIVHCAISMLLGLVGGIIAKSFYARREKPAAQAA
jgi:hypothetical protein